MEVAKPQQTRRLLSQQPPPALFAPRCAQRPPLLPRASRSPAAVFRPSAVVSVSIAAIDPRLSSAVRGPHLRRRASEILPQSYTSRPTLSLPTPSPETTLPLHPRLSQMASAPPPPQPILPPQSSQHLPDLSASLLSWEGDKMSVSSFLPFFIAHLHSRFNIYIYDYCHKRGFKKTAKELLIEADIPPESAPPINARQGLLFE